jgi:hypothetical protein
LCCVIISTTWLRSVGDITFAVGWRRGLKAHKSVT